MLAGNADASYPDADPDGTQFEYILFWCMLVCVTELYPCDVTMEVT